VQPGSTKCLYALPEDRRRRSLSRFPLIDNGFAGRTDLDGQLLLAEAEPVPQGREDRRVGRWHGRTTHGHEPPAAASIGPSIPVRHEPFSGLPRCRGGEFPETGSRVERGGETPVTSGGAQGPHVDMEFIGQQVQG
jgi:hypothetical protein